jgi:5'-nucleotidase
VPGQDPMGRTNFWFTVVPIERTEPGTDLWAMERGYVSVTPLGLDLTDPAALERLSAELPLDVPTELEPAEAVEEDES